MPPTLRAQVRISPWKERIGPLGREPPEHLGPAAEKRCITGEARGNSGPGELSRRFLLASCLKLYQLQTKRDFRHKGRLPRASARPGLALEFRNPSPQSSQTGPTILVTLLLPPSPHCRNAKILGQGSSPGLAPIVDPGDKLIRLKEEPVPPRRVFCGQPRLGDRPEGGPPMHLPPCLTPTCFAACGCLGSAGFLHGLFLNKTKQVVCKAGHVLYRVAQSVLLHRPLRVLSLGSPA